jgi:AcrR family transcriptional regulator
MTPNALDDATPSVPTAPAAERTRVAAPAQRLIEAAAECLARWGIAKTTVDDVARAAGVSRATVYRYFGGKDDLLLAVALYEEGRCFAAIAPRLERCRTLEETLEVTVHEGTRFLREHALLDTLLRHEPEAILPHLAFDRLSPLLYRTTAFLAPYLERHLVASAVPATAEWLTRLVLSYWFEPAAELDPAHPGDARRLVHRYLLPGLAADRLDVAHDADSTVPTDPDLVPTDPEPVSTDLPGGTP